VTSSWPLALLISDHSRRRRWRSPCQRRTLAGLAAVVIVVIAQVELAREVLASGVQVHRLAAGGATGIDLRADGLAY